MLSCHHDSQHDQDGHHSMIQIARFASKINFFVLVLLLTTIWPTMSRSDVPTEEQLLAQIEKSWAQLDSYWATFEQINKYNPEEPPATYVGQLWLKRPNRVRLDYTVIRLDKLTGGSSIVEQDIADPSIVAATRNIGNQPSSEATGSNLAVGMEENVDEMIYSDDIKYLYRYDRVENTLTIMPMQEESLPLFLAFLVNEQRFRADRFKKRYQLESIAEEVWQGIDCYSISVLGKDPQDRVRREFWLDKSSLLPVRTRTSVDTEQIEVFFKDYKPNLSIEPEILQGQVPSDVKVIDLTSPE